MFGRKVYGSIQRLTWLLMAAVLVLAGCAPVVRAEQVTITDMVRLQEHKTVGQTFTANYEGLTGVALFIDPQKAAEGSGELRLRLFYSPEDSLEIAQAVIPFTEISQPNFYRFSFPAVAHSSGVDFYYEVALAGTRPVEIGTGPGRVYLDGSLYADRRPLDAQAAFQLVYDSQLMVIGLLVEGFRWAMMLLAVGFLIVLPGWALLLILWRGSVRLNWLEKLAIAMGLGLSIYPLLFLWTDLFGLHMGAIYAWLPPVTALAYLLWRAWRNRPALPWRLPAAHLDWQDLALAVVIVSAAGIRWWVTRTLDVPLFGDSVHHTMIAQLMVDNGGLFTSWEPYTELVTFTYHFGLHTIIAAFHWVTGTPLTVATLWIGQVINLLAVITPALITLQITRSKLAAAVTILVAGLLLPMPMEYTNWGRYTQLAGQVLLPVACSLALFYFQRDKNENRIGLLLMNSLVWSALGFTHYRVLVFGILFFVVYWLFSLRSARKVLFDITALGLGAGVLFLPWFVRIFSGKVLGGLGAQLSTPASAISASTLEYNAPVDVFLFASPVLWMLFAGLLGYSLWLRSRAAAITAAWWGGLLVMANPRWLGLPGEGALSNFAVFIASYILISIIIGGGVGLWIECATLPLFAKLISRMRWQKGFVIAGKGAVLAGLVALAALGAVDRERDVNIPAYALVTQADLRAADWMQANLVTGSTVLVNSFSAFGDSVIAGADGGWWLPQLADFKITVPPITYGFDRGPDPDYTRRVNALTAVINREGLNANVVWKELSERGVRYVYIGQQRGEVNTNQVLLNPEKLLNSPHYRLIYQQDRVLIFEVEDLPES